MHGGLLSCSPTAGRNSRGELVLDWDEGLIPQAGSQGDLKKKKEIVTPDWSTYEHRLDSRTPSKQRCQRPSPFLKLLFQVFSLIMEVFSISIGWGA